MAPLLCHAVHEDVTSAAKGGPNKLDTSSAELKEIGLVVYKVATEVTHKALGTCAWCKVMYAHMQSVCHTSQPCAYSRAFINLSLLLLAHFIKLDLQLPSLA